jgi:hypothetical protein
MTEVSIEAVPVVTGVLIGLLCWQLVPRRLRQLIAVALSVPSGALITYAAGEFQISWGFVVFDIGQVVIAALLTGVVVTLRARRVSTRLPHRTTR